MAPHAAAALCIAADAMPALADLAIDRMEPSDARHPAPAPADAAQAPRLGGQHRRLARITAPMFAVRTLPDHAPALRCLRITGAGGALPQAMLPSDADVQALLAAGLPLQSVSINGVAAAVPPRA
ncbi:hypothetical protein IWQ56_001319 [Coemansia nantahalensis]|nr:hypothetical protein IWQ56_001319 [Coemansia nantahalensis]